LTSYREEERLEKKERRRGQGEIGEEAILKRGTVEILP
jgi:hypothetical protein